MRYLILCRSLTYAQRAASALEHRGIRSGIIKAPQHLRDRGCGYALSMTRRFAEAVTVLRDQKLLTGRLFQKEENGEYREVSEYDLFG